MEEFLHLIMTIIEILLNPYVLLLILSFLSTIFYASIKGKVGEFFVALDLKSVAKENEILLNDIMIKTETGTHQIDHILLSKRGIFVIETKNYIGLITGNEHSTQWVQHLGKKKYYFNNPIHQNYGHIKALEEILNLDEDKFISIVCVADKAKLQMKIPNVVQLSSLKKLIKSYNNEILSGSDLINAQNILLKNNIEDKKLRKKHVQDIKENIAINKEKENNMICPKCGGTLIKRQGKYGDFIGCSNYPKCKYTKQI